MAAARARPIITKEILLDLFKNSPYSCVIKSASEPQVLTRLKKKEEDIKDIEFEEHHEERDASGLLLEQIQVEVNT